MTTLWRWVALGLLGGVGLWTGWMLGPKPRPLSYFAPARPGWEDRLRFAGQWVWRRVTMERIRQDAVTMRINVTQWFLTVLVLAGGIGLVLGLSGIPWPIVALGVIGTVLGLPNVVIRRRFARWQRRVVAGLPAFLHHLQILLDLGLPLIPAIEAGRQRVRGPLGDQLDRVLFDLQRGLPVAAAFGQMATRVRRMEAVVLAAILGTTAGRRLSGKALEPLVTMLNAIQYREEERITGQVDQTMSTIPILAVFSGMVMGLYFLLAQALSGLHGLQL
ncbi:Type II secretion system (T2SS), protein F [Sulfobacillus thermosulfidooxidans DSM 9293]|uniref:Type II secretion system (T2SS), protein F n=1 Tax=Sulfobacillus thermosulfidooxidans (strain DSM 9293 / VKM B-1269 / AT-1) TaxID=929705 RepID=A0A1W1W864_SULTA|nr:type II secretion system F family protein [Sulfobacillus thermosulfidooxidans]SMC01943.1 Type II secretion system (T2SS), protein F [Sulfobacillus thermosulfidooxidans DSM 9293]